MARFQQQATLGSIANPRQAEAQAKMTLADTLQQFGQFGMERYQRSRIESAQEEAQEVEPGVEAPELRGSQTMTGRAYNQMVMAGHAAAIKNDYTRRIAELEVEHKDDPVSFEAKVNAYRGELLNSVSPDIRNTVGLDFDQATIRPAIGIKQRHEARIAKESLLGMQEAVDTIGDDAARAAREGDALGMQHNQTAFYEIVNTMEEMGQVDLAQKLQKSFDDRMDKQIVLGQFDAASNKEQFIKSFMDNPPADLSPEESDKLAGEMLTMWRREKSLIADGLATRQKKMGGEIKDYVQFLSNGGEDTDELQAKFSPDVINATYEPEKAAEINAQIADHQQFNTDYRMVKTATPEELTELVEGAKPTGPEDYGREADQYNRMIKAVKARNDQLAKDPAAFVIADDENLAGLTEQLAAGDFSVAADYTASVRAKQERLGVSPRSVALLPDPLANALATQINDMTQGGEVAVNTINGLKAAFGDEWRTIERQLSADKKIGESAKIISMTPEGPGQVTVAEALIVPEAEYKGFIGDDNVKDIKKDSGEVLDPLRNTLRVGYGDSGVKTANSIQRGVERTAMKLIADGKETDVDDALESAYEIIMGDTELYDTYRVPKDERPDTVNMGVKEYISQIKSGAVEIFTPPSAQLANEQDAAEVFRRALQLTPITTIDGSGVTFVDQNGAVLRRKDGTPFEVNWYLLREAGYGE